MIDTVERIKPDRIVLDSLSEIRLLAQHRDTPQEMTGCTWLRSET
jgi:hypothetical protein